VVPGSGSDDDAVYWLEGRPLEGGRNVLCQWKGTGDDIADITPEDVNVRTRVHEYGGGATTFAGDTLYYSEFVSQQLYKLSLSSSSKGGEAKAVTTEPDGQYRYADGIYDETRKILICVREDHGPDGKADPKDVVNEMVALNVATGKSVVLVKGYDFVASPRLSNDGKSLACIVWDHPNMPWDATKLVTVSLPENLFDENALFGEPQIIAGHDGDTSVMQPLYHPVTGTLLYISDESGYYNLYALNSGDTTVHSLLPMDVDFGGASPGWMLGQMGYCVLEDGRLAATIGRDGASVLLLIDVDGARKTEEFTSEHGLPRQFGSVQIGSNGNLYFMGGDPSTPTSVYRWDSKATDPAVILKSSSQCEFGSSVISAPKRIEFPTTLGTAFGYYYPPKNGDFECTTQKAPPLLVKAHGG
jgi:dipeptidyl aminopeptidase/acylaminoacyl peptidase